MTDSTTPCGKPAVARVTYKDERNREHLREPLCSAHHQALHARRQEADSAFAAEPPEPGSSCGATW